LHQRPLASWVEWSATSETRPDILLRRIKSSIRRAESFARRWLPSRLGGAFQESRVPTRLLCAADLDQIHHLTGMVVGDSTARLLCSRDSFCVGGLLDGHLVGLCWCTPRWHHLNIPGHWLSGLVVDPRLRRRHLGQIVIRGILDEARQRSIPQLRADISESNSPSVATLRGAGFQVIQRLDWSDAIAGDLRSQGFTRLRSVVILEIAI